MEEEYTHKIKFTLIILILDKIEICDRESKVSFQVVNCEFVTYTYP